MNFLADRWGLPVAPWSLAVLLLISPKSVEGQAQSDRLTAPLQTAAAESVTVIPGPNYRAGWFHLLFLGNHYRDLWTTPVRVEVLDLDSFAGGLKAAKRGGGQQTRSLRF